VGPISFDPDAVDLAVLREMYRDGAVSMAGIDPRLNATQIAQKLRIGRTAVATRLKRWKESGFLRSYDVWLNPALWGWCGAGFSVRVDHHRVKGDLFRKLALVDGVVMGLELLGDWISVGLVAPDLTAVDRRVALVHGLAGVREVEDPQPWKLPEPRRQLTSLDLRIVRALRERPTAGLSEIAHRARISNRTMTRRYGTLVDDAAVWFVPIFDFTALARPVVALNVVTRSGVAREMIARKIRARFPLTLDSSISSATSPHGLQAHAFSVILPSAAALEEFERSVGSVEGVVEIESLVMVRIHSFPEWFDHHLRTLAPGTGPLALRPPSRGSTGPGPEDPAGPRAPGYKDVRKVRG
jgi:DNA-binding Lrp family transcriptional regulator